MHFGAAKQQFTLHTGMIYWYGGSQSFCSISDNNSHDPAAIWAHLLPIIRLTKEYNPLITTIHFYSDGPSTQYRQKKNFFLHNIFTFKLGFEYSTWSFSESGHGKSVADGIGGTVKRILDKQVAYGHDVISGLQAVELLVKSLKSIKCFYIVSSDIDNIRKLIPINLKPLSGTMLTHQIIIASRTQIQYRCLSCFCGEKRGLCSCYDPRTHTFENKKVQTSLHVNILNQITVAPEIHTSPHKKCNTISFNVTATTENFNKETIVQNLDSIDQNVSLDEIDILPFDLINTPIEIFDDIKSDYDSNVLKVLDSSTINNGEHEYKDSNSISNDTTKVKNFREKSDYDGEVLKVIDLRTINSEDEYEDSTTDDAKQHNYFNERKGIQTRMKRKLMEGKENEKHTQNKISRKGTSLRKIIITRNLQCIICKNHGPFQDIRKCMACKNFVCSSCRDSDGTVCYDDYICDICFGE